MAVSGNLNTSNQYIKYTIECVENSPNIANNTTNVTVRVRFFRTNTGYETYGSGTVYCKINGTTYSASVTSSQKINSSGITLFTKTIDIGHESDGRKTLAMSAWISHSQFSASEQSYSQTLTTIPRTSSFSTSSSVNAGSTINITINRASTSFTHDLYLRVGDGTWLIAKGAATSVSNWTVPNEVMNKITTSTSGVGIIDCYTLNGSSLIGSVSKSITINIPSTIVPSFSSLSLERVDNVVPSSWGVYVKGKSKVKYTVNSPAGSYGSTITSYKVTGCGGTWTSQTVTTGELWATGTQTFTATITDSRGRTTTKTSSITIYDYWAPVINSFTAIRCNSDGSANEEGQYTKVLCNYSYANVNSKNTITCKVKYRVKGGSWSSETSFSNNTSAVIGGNAISNNSTYEVSVSLVDTFSTVTKQVDLPSAKVTMDFRNGGNGIAIGKVSEKDGLEIDWQTWVNNTLYINKTGDGAMLASFNTERPWSIKQGGTGSESSLDFVSSVGDKSLRVLSPNANGINIRVSDDASLCGITIAGNNVFHSGNCYVTNGTNQTCYRFENGLQIIRQLKHLGTINISNAWGNLFTQGSAQTNFDNYVLAFSSAPQVSMSAGGDGTLFVLQSIKPTTTHPGSYELARGASVTGLTNVSVYCISVGQWK